MGESRYAGRPVFGPRHSGALSAAGFCHIPIPNDDDKLVGVLSIGDILRHLMERHAART
jgi:CBS domain-containing protein